jgi:hypothetical protein
MSERKIGGKESLPPPHVPGGRGHPADFALQIPPPRDRSSAVRRHSLASSWAEELGELAAELVSEGRLVANEARRAQTKGRKK